MTIVVASIAFVVALLCAGVMGYAIQRGATCTVAAIDEIVTERSVRRLLSLGEAALWVGGGLVVAASLRLMPQLPPGYAATTWTVVGGALLGLGAFVNGACVFGAIARLGSGEWAYVFTPIGFYVGCVSVKPLFGAPEPLALSDVSPVLRAPAWIAVLFVAFALWRVARPWLRRDRNGVTAWHAALAAHVWTPHAATTVIGLSFVVMLLLVGGWAYTDVLAELAHGMSTSIGARGFLFAALLLGAMLGGWTAGLLRHTRLSPSRVAGCVVGGMLMGWGSLLLPGGNDSLILVGMPLAWPYAWLAFATMCVTIAGAQLARRRWSRPSR